MCDHSLFATVIIVCMKTVAKILKIVDHLKQLIFCWPYFITSVIVIYRFVKNKLRSLVDNLIYKSKICSNYLVERACYFKFMRYNVVKKCLSCQVPQQAAFLHKKVFKISRCTDLRTPNNNGFI